MNVPNILTLIRLFFVPLFALFFFSNTSHCFAISMTIFFTAGCTDVLDGYIARKYQLITKWGTVIDPLADKLMLLVVLASLTMKNIIPLWVIIVIFLKEALMILGGIILYKKDTVIPSNILGKLATCLFYISILLISLNFQEGYLIIYGAVIVSIVSWGTYLAFYLKNRIRV